METIKYNEIVWNTIQILNLNKHPEIIKILHNDPLLELKNIDFTVIIEFIKVYTIYSNLKFEICGVREKWIYLS
jgi:hypothetical protein